MTESELSDFKEFVHNGEFVNWNEWVYLSNITPYQAARLAYCIDPIKWDANQFSGGGKSEAIPKDLTKRLLWWEQWLANIQSSWSLADLIAELGDDAPMAMVEAVPFGWDYKKSRCKPSQRAFANTLFYSEADRQKDIQKKAYLEAMQEFEAQKTIAAVQHLEQPINAPLDDIEPIKTDSNENHATTAPTEKTKPRKKLKPIEREASEGLLLVYEICKHYSIEYLDEMPAIKAWGKIISGEFQHDLIKNVSPAKTFILLSGENKVEKKDFLEKYRKRFELVTKLTNQQD